jgi:hypothetical protein
MCVGQRRKVKCSGQSGQQPIQADTKCDTCAEAGMECIWSPPQRTVSENITRSQANAAGQAGGPQVGSERERAQSQSNSACTECVSAEILTQNCG